MAKIGGYQVIDLKNKNLISGVGMQYSGLYDLIEGTRKPILVSGIQLDSEEYHDAFAEVSANGSQYEFDLYGYLFTINDNDVVEATKITE